MKNKLLSNTTTSLLAQLVTVIYGFVLPRLILEQYGSEVNGLTQSIKQFLGIISFLDLGVGQVVRSALYRPLAENDRDQISRIIVSGRRFYRRIAYALAAYVLLLMCVYPYLVDNAFGWLYTAALIGAMAVSTFAQYYFGIINEQLLQADQRGYLIYILQIVTNLLNLAVCVWLIQRDCSIHEIKLAASLIYLLRPAVMELYIRRHYRIDRSIGCSETVIAQKWNGIAQHISAVVLDGTDTVVLTLFSTLSNVSVYSVYYMVISSIQNFYRAATAGIQSAAGALWARQDRDAINRMFSWVELGLHFVTVLLFSCTGILIVPFIRVYTNGLTDAAYIQPVFAALIVLAYGIRCLRTPYNIWILAGGHFKQTQRCHILAAAINLTISVATVSYWGLTGIAMGTLVAMAYQTIWMAVYNSRNLVKWPLKRIVKQFMVDALEAGLIWLAASWIPLREVSYLGWFLMALQVGVIALVICTGITVLFYRRILADMTKRYLQSRKKLPR